MKKKLIPAQTSDTASHDPRWMLAIIFFYKLLKISDIFIRSFSFSSLHFVALGENKSHWYLKRNNGTELLLTVIGVMSTPFTY